MDEAVWNHAVYSKNRERLLNAEIADDCILPRYHFTKSHLGSRQVRTFGHLIMSSVKGTPNDLQWTVTVCHRVDSPRL
jgi:hypothetical protein